MSDFIKLSSVALDCPNASELAAFYADITGGRVTFQHEVWATVDGPGGRIDFQTVPGYTPPTWPDSTSSIQMHLDFYVDDLEATGVRVLAAGATKFDFQPNSDHCYVYADPAGHPFCVSTWHDAQNSPGDARPVAATAAENTMLLSYLNAQRDHVLGILEGLDEDALRRPLLASGWSCLGLVQHLTIDIERFWFRGVVAGERAVTDDAADDVWSVRPDVPADAVFTAYRDEIDRANMIIAATDLHAAPAWWPGDLFGDWRLDDLRDIVLHVITESACHAGHLDAARELIDGRTWLVLTG